MTSASERIRASFSRFHFPTRNHQHDKAAAPSDPPLTSPHINAGGNQPTTPLSEKIAGAAAAAVEKWSAGGNNAMMINATNMPSPPRIGYLFSAPLVHKAGGQAKELGIAEGMNIDIGQELARLKNTLYDAQRKVMFRAEVATVKNCRKLLTIGCRMLHYTGIGKPSCLIFEKEKPVGEANVLGIDTLTELFAAGGVRTQLVFVSATHSEIVGRAFISAGVRHVVATRWDAKVSDRAAVIFAEFFYLSIVMGRTVRQAFEVATTAAVTETGAVEDEQFLLLPHDGDHDLAIFDDCDLGDFADESPPPIPNTCDQPPVPFVGRNVVVQEVVSLLSLVTQGTRCITIRGKTGIGKTALAAKVCQYLAERNLFDAIYQVPLQRKDYRSYEKETLCKAIGTAIGFDDASNEREIVYLLQDKHPSSRIIMVLDGPDRFVGHSHCFVQVLSFLLGRIHGMHLLITAEGSILSSGTGRLESSSEKIVHLGPLSDVATAHMLVNIAPPGFNLDQMISRPYATRDEAYAELAASPILRELRCHPKAIMMFAPLLEEHRLEVNWCHFYTAVPPPRIVTGPAQPEYFCAQDLLEKAKQSYAEASQATPVEVPSAGEEVDEGKGGLLQDGSARDVKKDGQELDPSCLERETEESTRYIRDPNCQRLWLEVVRQGGARQSSGMHQGVPWYRLTDALQEELRKTLVDAMRIMRIRINPKSSPISEAKLPVERQEGAIFRRGTVGEGTQAGPEDPSLVDGDIIRGLEATDIQFIKDRLGAKPDNDLIRITDYAVFCEGWVPVQSCIRALCREWLCNNPRLLHGFLSRKQTETMLENKPEGVFLFRFSTSHLGLLSISFVGQESRQSSGQEGTSATRRKAQIRHFLVQVEGDGRCVVLMEPGRQQYASLEDVVIHSASLQSFYPGGLPKEQALVQLKEKFNG